MNTPTCEACCAQIPLPEYGVMMADDVWERIAPRPGRELSESGLLCFDCQDERLRERLDTTLREVLSTGDGSIGVYGQPTARMRELMDPEWWFDDDNYHPVLMRGEEVE